MEGGRGWTVTEGSGCIVTVNEVGVCGERVEDGGIEEVVDEAEKGRDGGDAIWGSSRSSANFFVMTLSGPTHAAQTILRKSESKKDARAILKFYKLIIGG